MSNKPRQSRRKNKNCLLKQRSRRALRAERLEDRTLLAADLGFHNAAFPVDTNADGVVGSGDALAVINDLNRYGARSLATASVEFGEAEGGTPKLVDVDGDNYVTPSDVRRVINALNAEGETGPVMRVTARIFERPADYPFDGGGNRVEATNEIDSIGVGQDFVVKLLVEDIRTMGTREGVFSAYVDVNFDNPEVATLVGSLPGVTHPQTNNPTPYLHNNLYGQRAEPVNGNALIDTDGNGSLDQLDFIGSFAGTLQGPGAGEFVLVEWAMTAGTAGSLTILAEPTTEDPSVDPNDAGESPLFDPGIFGQDAPVCPSQSTSDPCMGEMEFVPDTITVVDRISAVPNTFNITEGAPAQTFDLLANDINNTNGTLTIMGTTQGTLGSVINNGNNVTYTPQPNASGTDTFDYTIGNGLGDTSTATVTVNISPVNDSPVNSVPGPQSTNEDTPLALPAISVSDGDGNVNLTVGLSGVLGTISVPATSGVTITNPDSANVTLQGLVNDLNNALSSVTYRPNLNANGAGSLTINSSDGTASDSDTVNITINPVNDGPINTVPGPQTVFNTETLAFNAGAFSVQDVDASTLQVTLTVGEGTLQFGVGGTPSASLNATGTISSINSQLSTLIYDPNDTFVGNDTLTMTTSDNGQTGLGGTLMDVDTVTITVTPPETPFAASDFFDVEEDPTTPLGFNLSELLNNDIKPLPAANNTLTLTAINSLSPATGSFTTTAGGALTFNESSGAFTYTPVAEFSGADTFTYTIESSPDAGDGPSTGTVNINVQPINDGPINTVPGAQSVDEDNALSFSGADLISVEDIDAGSAGVSVTLTVSNGVLNVGGGGQVTSNGSASVQINGTVSQVNNSLTGLTYTPTANYAGADTLTVSTNDNGNTGGARGNPDAANPLTDNDTVNITIQPINDAPTIVVPGSQSFLTDFDNTFSSTPNPFQISDVDAGSDDVQVDLLIGDGTLTISSPGSVQVTPNPDGNNGIRLMGAVDNINTALGSGVRYQTLSPGGKTLTATVNDLGNNGGIAGNPSANNPLSASATVAIEVLDFVPSNIGGFVYVDADNDAVKETGEAGLEGVRITLSGTTFRNTPVSMEAFTSANGSYLFGNLEPGNYQINQDQPVHLNDGKESFSSPITAAGNDHATIAIPVAGNIDSRNNNFGERGLTSRFISMYDLLDSQFQRSGALLGTNGTSDWSAFLGAGWEGYSNPRVDLVALTLTVSDSGGQDHQVNLRSADPARHGRTYMDRIMTRKYGSDEVIRITGSAADFGFGAASGEGEGDLAAAPESSEGATSSEMYAQAVDQFFGELA